MRCIDVALNGNPFRRMTYWCKELDLRDGDIVSFTFVEADNATAPEEIIPTDSPAYIEEQRQFAELQRNFVPDETPMLRTFPSLRFECRLNGVATAVAAFEGDEEHILCSLAWKKWRPDRCRVFIRSFGDTIHPESRKETEWLRTNLSLGDSLEVCVAV